MTDFNKTGSDGLAWPQTMDAQVWVEAFRHYEGAGSDDDAMIGWFSNAIMAGHDAAVRASPPDIFAQQAHFMEACGQTIVGANPPQALMYDTLIREEHGEWIAAALRGEVEDLDAVVDQIVVLIGYALSQGWDIRGAWDEVLRSNMAKVDPETGMVHRREDGKILKPEGWTPPNLRPFLRRG